MSLPLTVVVRGRAKQVETPGRRRRRRIRRLLLLLVLVALIGGSLYLYLGPVREAEANASDAAAQVEAAQAKIDGTIGSITAARLDSVRRNLSQARTDVNRLLALEQRYGTLLDLAAQVPKVGDRVGTARGLVKMVDKTLHAADAAVDAGQALLKAPHLTGNAGTSSSLVAALVAQQGNLSRARADLAQAAALAKTLPASTGLGLSADHMLATFRAKAGPADQALGTLMDVASLARHRTTMLLLSQDPAEQRPTGGLVGFASLLQLDQRGLRIGSFMPSIDVDRQFVNRTLNSPDVPGTVAAPSAGAYYASWQAWFFRDANWSPDFPTAARQLLAFYRRGQGLQAQGVIVFEPSLILPLLTLTGPVPVPGRGVTLTVANAMATLRYHEYVLNEKQFTLQSWQAITHRLLTLPAADGLRLAQIVLTAVQNRTVSLYLQDPSIEARLRTHGLAGVVAQGKGDYLYVVDTNLGYNKVDPYIRRTVHMTVTPQPDGSTLHLLTIDYLNTLPPATVLGVDAGGNNITYVDYLRVIVPAHSVLVKQQGWEAWAPDTVNGLRQYSGGLSVAPSRTQRVILTYRSPAPKRAAPYSLHVQVQPGGNDLTVSACVVASSGKRCHPDATTTFNWTVT